MKRIVLLFFVLLSILQIKANESLQDSIKKANKLYLSKNYEASAKTYNSIVKLGYQSPELFYNLGNAYYKANKIALAIVNYERALKLNPGFDDAQYNLEIANKLIIDKIEVVPEFFLTTWFKAIISVYSFNTWAYFSVFLFLLSLVFLGVYFFSKLLSFRKFSFFFALILFFLVIITFVFAQKQYQYQVKTKYAIIYETTVTLKSSPSESGTNIFPLHEGTKVQMLENVGEWTQVKIADGKQAWLKKENILEI
jgi:tetratricopeptide (TPR) repeat protein